MHGFAVFFLLFSSFCATAPFGYSEGLNGFSLELIHRDSPLSPFYNSSISKTESIANTVLRSISRVSSSLLPNENESSPKTNTIIIPDIGEGEYLMRIYIGTPPVERFAIADTGSDLIWVQCLPCDNYHCFQQDTPYYDPTKSSTFTIVPCVSKPCAYIPQNRRSCGKSGQCEYEYSYLGKAYTNGELAVDAISFGDAVSVQFPKSIFGCGHNNSVVRKEIQKTTGLVGLGAGPLSLVSQLGDSIGHKFSYCLVPLNSNTNSKLKFGSEATISGNGVVSTPLIISSSLHYLLNLEGVTVGQNRVQTSYNNGGGNIIIDSGTTLTLLELNFHNDFVASVREAIGVEKEVAEPPFSFCFNAKADNQINFPDFVFHFTGADVTLKFGNLFIAYHNSYCLAVMPLRAGSASIFGNIAQVNFEVGYDLEGKTVSFAPTDCTNN